MSERKVWWKALADFSQVRREADRTSRSLEDLERSEKNLGRTSEEESARVSRSHRASADSATGLRGAFQRLAEARRGESQAAKAQEASGRAVAAAQQAQATAAEKAERSNLRLEQSALRVTSAEQAAERAARNLEKAQSNLANVKQKSADNSEKLAAAEQRLATAQERVSRTTTDVARARLSQAENTRRATQAENDLASAAARLNAAQAASASSSGRLSSAVGSLGNNFRNARREASGFGGALGAIKITALAAGIAHLIPLLGQLGAGLMAVAGAIGPMFNSLAVIPNMVGGIAASFGTVLAGFSGIGGALKAAGQQSAQAGGKAVRAERDTARAARDAAESVARAKEDQIRSIRDAAEAVEQAKEQQIEANRAAAEAVVQAEKQQKDAVRDAAEDVRRTKEQQAEAVRNSSQRIADAAQIVIDAEREQRLSIEDLNNQRRRAIEYMDEMSDRYRDTGFSIERAQISLEEARASYNKTMADPASSDLDRRKADLNYREAVARLSDAQEARAKAEEEHVDAQAKGVAGSDIMVAANNRVEESSKRVTDAKKNLSSAHEEHAKVVSDSARAVAEAERRQVEVVRESARAVKDARDNQARTARDSARAVRDALENQQRVHRDSARAVRDALEAQARAAEGYQDVMSGAGGGVDKFAEAMSKLSPAGQRFVKFLLTLKPLLTDLRNTAQEAFLPGIERGLRNLLPLFPMIKREVGDLGKILGDGFAEFTEVVASNESQEMMQRLFDSNEKVTRRLTQALGPLFLAITRIADAARPLNEWLAQLALNFSEWADASTRVNAANGDLAKTMDNARSSLSMVGNILKNFGGILWNVGKAGRQTGMEILTIFNDWLAKWNEFTGSDEGQRKIHEYFQATKPGFLALAKIIGRIGDMLIDLAVNPETTEMLESLAGPGMDAVERIVTALTTSGIGTGLVDALIGIGEGIATILENGGGGVLTSFVNSIEMLVTALSNLVKIPGVAQTLSAIALGAGAFKAVKVAGALTGITPLVRGVRKATRPPGDGSDAGGYFAAENRQKRRAARQERRSSGGGGFLAFGGGSRKKPAGGGARRSGGMKAAGGAAGAAGMAGMMLSGLLPENLQGAGMAISSLLMVLPMLGAAIAAIGAPITLAIAAIAGLVAGITYLWKNNEDFRNWVTGAWNTIKDAVVGAWKNHIWPALQAFGNFVMDSVVPVLKMLWGHAKTIFAAIASFVVSAWQNVIQPALAALWGFITDRVVPVFQWLWNNIKVIFGFIGALISAWWRNIVKPLFDAVVGFVKNTLLPIFSWLWGNLKVIFGFIGALVRAWWNSVVKPLFNTVIGFVKNTLLPIFSWFWNSLKTIFGFIGALVRTWWNNVVKPLFNAVVGFVKNTLGPIFSWLKDKVFVPVWNGIKSAISGAWKFIKPILSSFGNFIKNDLVGKFRSGISAITSIWDTLKKVISAPINWVITHVINNGLIRAFNAISSKVGGPSMAYASTIGGGGPPKKGGNSGLQMASGGPVRGRVRGTSLHPRQDNIPADLTAGEWVHPVASVKYYGPRFMEMIRRRMIPKQMLQQLADGGPVHGVSDDGGSAADPYAGMGGGIGDFFRDAWDVISSGNPLDVLKKGVSKIMGGMPGGEFLKSLGSSTGMKLASMMGEKLKSLFNVFNSSESGTGARAPKGGVVGWQNLKNWALRAIPGTVMTSGLRTGTLGGKSSLRSYHNQGRAVDLVGPSMMKIFNTIRSAFPNATELIHSPAGGRQLKNGRPYYYSGFTRQIHFDHVHWAMNQGGLAGRDGSPRFSGGRQRLASGGLVGGANPRLRYASGGPVSPRTGRRRFAYGGLADPSNLYTSIQEPRDAMARLQAAEVARRHKQLLEEQAAREALWRKQEELRKKQEELRKKQIEAERLKAEALARQKALAEKKRLQQLIDQRKAILAKEAARQKALKAAEARRKTLLKNPKKYKSELKKNASQISSLKTAGKSYSTQLKQADGKIAAQQKVVTAPTSVAAPVYEPATTFTADDFSESRATTAQTAAVSNTYGNMTNYEGDHNQNTANFNIVVNNPKAEAASDSIQDRLQRTAQLGLIGGKRSST